MDKFIKEIDPDSKVINPNEIQRFEDIIRPDNYDAQHEFVIKIVEEYNLSEIIYLSLGVANRNFKLREVLRFYDAGGCREDIRTLFLNRYFEKFKLPPNALIYPFSSFYINHFPIPHMYKDMESDLNFIQDFKKTSDSAKLFEIYQRIFDMHMFIINTNFTYQTTKLYLAYDYTKLIKVLQNKIKVSSYIRLTLTQYLRDKPSLAELIPEILETIKILEQYGIREITEDLLKFARDAHRELELFEVLMCWKDNLALLEEDDVRKAIISMFLATKTSLEESSKDVAEDFVPIPKQLIWEITQMPGYERFIKKFEKN